MNSTPSVFTMPYFVCTFEPSTMGSRSRCTPSRDTSGPACSDFAPAILSISSMKTMPSFSVRSSASVTMSSSEMSLSNSWSSRMRRASVTATVRFFFRFGSMSREHLTDVARCVGSALGHHHAEHRRVDRDLDLDFALLELAVAQQLLELVARAQVTLAGRIGRRLGLRLAAGADDEHRWCVRA